MPLEYRGLGLIRLRRIGGRSGARVMGAVEQRVAASGVAQGSVRSFCTSSRSVGSDNPAKASDLVSNRHILFFSTIAAISSTATMGGSADMTRAASIPRCQNRLASRRKSPSCARRQASQT